MTALPATESEAGVREHLATLRRQKIPIALVAGLAVTAAVLVSLLQDPRYQAEAQVLVPTERVVAELGATDSEDPERAIRNEVDFVESDAVTDTVQAEVGDDVELEVAASDDRDTLRFRAVAGEADEAAEAADLYAATYLDERQKQRRETVDSTRATVRARIEEINETIALTALEATPEATASIEVLTAERLELQSVLSDLQLSSELAEAGGARLTRQAEVPEAPFEPNMRRNVAVALGIGLLLGIAFAFVREQLDDTVTSRADLEAVTGGLPVLGIVPRPSERRGREPVGLAAADDPTSSTAEAYRTLRTAVQFLGVDRSLSTVLITSPGVGDGKTTTVANLGLSVSRAGRSCAVVCGDLRRPCIHTFYDLDQGPGLTTVLVGEATVDGALQPVPGEDGLTLLAAGDVPPNPSELLSSDAAAKAIRHLADAYELVLIDAPPVLPVSDALVLAQQVDGVILVADAHRTELSDLREAWQRLTQIGATLLGTVLNDADIASQPSYQLGDASTSTREGDRPA
jgi:capsular exopolysaccharide synthesis family protein